MTTEVSRYTNERLVALWDRVEQLEAAVETALTQLESEAAERRSAALRTLHDALMESFKGALLCSRDTTDEHLDRWLPEIEKHEGGSRAARQQPEQEAADEVGSLEPGASTP